MRLCLQTNSLAYEGMTNLANISHWAMENGYAALEIGPTVPLTEEQCESVRKESGVSYAALIYCRNFLSTDAGEAELHISELRRRIELAARLGIDIVVTSTGIDKTIEEGVYDRADSIRRTPARSLDRFLEVFYPIIELAEKLAVRIAFENCPLMGNIAISPEMWTKIFERMGSKNVGLAYDPSHLHWQFIDPYEPIKEFADRIFHFHAKDTEIDRDRLARSGFLTDFKWWQYRIPGGGELDWQRLLSALRGIGYTGYISAEHEDARYEGSLELVQEGLIKSREYLNNLMK